MSSSIQSSYILDDQNFNKIDKEIGKFHHKIEELEEQKRKMNINFKPFQYTHSPIKKECPEMTPSNFKKIKNN